MTNFSPELFEKAKAAKNAEELLALAKANNVEITAEEANTYFNQLNPASGELSDDELDNVSGGAGGSSNRRVDIHGCCQLWEPGNFLSGRLGDTFTLKNQKGEWGTYVITLDFLYSQELLGVCPELRTCVYCRFYRGSDQTCTNYSVNF